MKPTRSTGLDGSQHWFLNGRRHREDGPAIIWPNGTEAWYFNGYLHREDGPAAMSIDGSILYFAFGIKYNSFEELIVSLIINK